MKLSKMRIIKQIAEEEGLTVSISEKCPNGWAVYYNWPGNTTEVLPPNDFRFTVEPNDTIMSILPKVYKAVKACHEDRCDYLDENLEVFKK